MKRILIVMWLRNIVTAFLRGSNKDLEIIWRLEMIWIGEDLGIRKDHECGELSKVEGEFFS
jgi:hypothetical protein